MIRPILFLLAILILFAATKSIAGGGQVGQLICNELGADMLRAKGWIQFTPADMIVIPHLVKQKKAELLNGTGEATTLECYNSLYPENRYLAIQRWYRRK